MNLRFPPIWRHAGGLCFGRVRRSPGTGLRRWLVACILVATGGSPVARVLAEGRPVAQATGAVEAAAVERYKRSIEPILKDYCFDCHGDGMEKGGVALDRLSPGAGGPGDAELWHKALRNVRAGLMPPAKKPQPTPEQRRALESWIKTDVFKTDPQHPDPGRVTVRRLNRVEYRNTIRDLMGIDYDTEKEFPADDTGHGFDNLAEVLTISPMLLEKYLTAASDIVARAVPTTSRAPVEHSFGGAQFRRSGVAASAPGAAGTLTLSYYELARVEASFEPGHAGRFRVLLDFNTTERYVDGQNDYNRARFTLRAGSRVLFDREFNREGNRQFRFEFESDLEEVDRGVSIEVIPLSPEQKRVRALGFRLNALTIRGPLAPEHHVRPPQYGRFFPKEPPQDAEGRGREARAILDEFAARAFRKPADAGTVERLARLAESVYSQSGKTFEAGIAQAMVAVLASPRFLFREEGIETVRPGERHPFVDEPALASRLSYFLWSSMPSAELRQMAGAGQLRGRLGDVVRRMLEDPKSEALMQNFTGQWLQARDVESIDIQARTVLAREEAPDPEIDRVRARSRELRERDFEKLSADEQKELAELRAVLARRSNQPLRAELSTDLRRSMRRETEKVFEHVLRGDRSLLELLDADYTYLNEGLGRHYGLTNLNLVGDELRWVALPADSPRGGVLTQGTVLVVTSNPTRTSPVKRGLFILENILGTPPPPAPPNVPALEEAARAVKGRELTLRETLALHREKPLCASCHARMDPPGLALENFNAMGLWRDQERAVPIDPAGALASGESFSGVRELKRILVTRHREAFYRTLTEKLLTYALGRGLEYHDVDTVDRIVARVEAADGRASALLMGIVESAPFQQRRSRDGTSDTDSSPVSKVSGNHPKERP